jgi:DNA-binding response OmpR family regulator
MESRSRKPKCRTLIVEDDATARNALAEVLRRRGHEVHTAESIGDALVSLRDNPGCILLDLILPDGNGVAVLRRARTHNAGCRIAIVTGVQDPFSIGELTDLKPDAVFEKPLDIPALLKWLDRSPSKTIA